jgi:hypothetical protein
VPPLRLHIVLSVTPLPDVLSVLPAPFEKRAVDPAPSTLSLEICTAFKQRKKKTWCMNFAGLQICRFISHRSDPKKANFPLSRTRYIDKMVCLHGSENFGGRYYVYCLVQKPARISTVQVINGSWREDAMPKSLCRGCNRMFTSLSAFDLHRTGKFQRKMRRCLTEQET